ncbi:MAG: DNA alkylation repair protein [Patescibacteria group bacterium]
MSKKLTFKNVIVDLVAVVDRKRAVSSARYFKTGKGEYGEGDVFVGITVPVMRAVAKKYQLISLGEIKKLLVSDIHEHRYVALLILCLKYQKEPAIHREIFEMYLVHTKFINNWDLVDTSARDIIGHYIWNHFITSKRRIFLTKLAKSRHLWERRISIVATHYGIVRQEFEETLVIADLLLKDTHDLIHKATGWMLREVGKKDEGVLKKFLDGHAVVMPRTMLRYSLERFKPQERLKYMKMKA